MEVWPMELSSKNMKKIILLITFAVFLFWGLQNYIAVLGTARNIFGLFVPFILGLCIAFILNVILRLVEKLWNLVWKKRNRGLVAKLQRPVCLVISIGIVFGAVLFLIFMVVPEIVKAISAIVDMLPKYINQLEPKFKELFEKLRLSFVAWPQINIDREKIVTAVVDYLKEGGSSLFSKTAGITASFFSGIFNLVLGFVFSIYVLLQKEKLAAQLKKFLDAFVDEKKINALQEVASVSNRIFSKFVTGQLTEATIIGLLCFTGMSIFSMPYAAMISTLVGFTALIPVVGAFIGTGVGAFLILMVEPMKAFWFIVFILALQQVEGDLIYPRVVGKSVGLPGIWVIIAVTIGGSSFGILGMLLSVPICSVLYCLLQQIVNNRLKRKQSEQPDTEK